MAKDFRDHYHRLTDEEQKEAFLDQRESVTRLYVSLIPFLFIEYVVHRERLLPTGLIFPIAYVLFWSFYYTYYQPSFLESHLSSFQNWNPLAIPAVLLGVCIWFVKYTVIELLHVLILRWIFTRPAPEPAPKPKEPPPPPPLDEVHWRHEGTQATRLTDARAQELARALALLGLSGDPSLEQIHQRYRELAKLFHPDLNPDVTDFGRRFIQIDQAYRLLSKAHAQPDRKLYH